MGTRLLALWAGGIATASLLGILATAVPTTAECPASQPEPVRKISDYLGVTFIATVTEASDDVDPPKADNAPFDWHVEMAVDQVYDGEVPDRLVMNGWSVGCTDLRGDQLHTGDHLLISTARLVDRRRDPSLLGTPVIWHVVDD